MRIFIFEHVCGGGMLGESLSDGLVAQGRAMLTAAADDFIAAGHEVTVTHDPRVELQMSAVSLRRVDNADELRSSLFASSCNSADAVLVIAPEYEDVLHQWRRLVPAAARCLNSSAAAIELAADKVALAQRLAARGVATIPSLAADGRDAHAVAADLLARGDAPVVLKPRDGAGCESTFISRTRGDVGRIADAMSGERWVIQPYRAGIAASVSFIAHADRLIALPAGRQHIEERDGALHYRGGSLPLDPALTARATHLARSAVEAAPGLRGFIGVDLILGDSPEGDAIVEINPRLTMSYCGLRAMCRTNLAAAMLDPDAPLRWSDRPVAFDSAGRVLQHIA